MADYSYIGSGKVYLKEYGAAAAMLAIGNCSALNFSVTEETKEQKDYTQPGGGTYNEVKRISAVECQITAAELSPTVLAQALYGASTAVTSAAVVDESHVGYLGGFIKTDFMPSAITTVKVGATTHTEGDDYDVVPGGIVIRADGDIANASTVLISYTKAATDVVQALVNSGKEYELVFAGLNEARSGKKTIVHAYRVKLGALQNLGLIGDEYAIAEMTGKLLKDTSKSGAGVSQYFKVEIEQ